MWSPDAKSRCRADVDQVNPMRREWGRKIVSLKLELSPKTTMISSRRAIRCGGQLDGKTRMLPQDALDKDFSLMILDDAVGNA